MEFGSVCELHRTVASRIFLFDSFFNGIIIDIIKRKFLVNEFSKLMVILVLLLMPAKESWENVNQPLDNNRLELGFNKWSVLHLKFIDSAQFSLTAHYRTLWCRPFALFLVLSRLYTWFELDLLFKPPTQQIPTSDFVPEPNTHIQSLDSGIQKRIFVTNFVHFIRQHVVRFFSSVFSMARDVFFFFFVLTVWTTFPDDCS